MNAPNFRAVGWLTKRLVAPLLLEAEVGTDVPDSLFIFEVSDSSLRYDRITRARLYGRRGVADCWIHNVSDQVVEVRREPADEFWGRRTVHHAGEVLEPLRLPGVGLDVGAGLAFMSG